MIEGELPASVEGLRRLAFDLGGVRDRVTGVERAVAGRLLPFDTGPGDLVGFDADGNPVLIDAAAGDGYGLTSDTAQTGGVKWQKPPSASVVRSSTTLTAPTNNVTISFTSENHDNASMATTGTTPITTPEAGIYAVTIGCRQVANGVAGYRFLAATINGSLNTCDTQDLTPAAHTAVDNWQTVSFQKSLAAGVTIGAYLEHNSGANLTYEAVLSVTKISTA